MRALLILLLAFYPYTLSAPAEVERGGVYYATASTPAAASVSLVQPPGIVATEIDRQGETITYRLDVAADAPMSRAPVELVLVVDGAERDSTPLRIWTDAVVPVYRIWLPVTRAGG